MNSKLYGLLTTLSYLALFAVISLGMRKTPDAWYASFWVVVAISAGIVAWKYKEKEA